LAVGRAFGEKNCPRRTAQSRVNEKLLKLAVVAIGVALTIGLFWSAP